MPNHDLLLPSVTITELLAEGLISMRTFNVCKTADLLTAGDIRNFRIVHPSFTSLRNCGLKSASELEEVAKLANYQRIVDTQLFTLPEPIKDLLANSYQQITADLEGLIDLDKLLPTPEVFAYLCLKDLNNLLNRVVKYRHINGNLHYPKYILVKRFIEIQDSLIRLEYADNDSLQKFMEVVRTLKETFDQDFIEERFRDNLSNIEQNYLERQYQTIVAAAPARARSFQANNYKTFFNLLPDLNKNTASFIGMWGNKKKSALDFYTEVLLRFREVIRRLEAINKDETARKYKIQFTFPFVPVAELAELQSFIDEHGHYPMFRVLDLLLTTSDNRDYDILSARLGIGKYDTPHSRNQIAEMQNISTERVRQVLSKVELPNYIKSRELWNTYLLAEDTLISPESIYFTGILSDEKVAMQFSAFAYFYSKIFPYEYVCESGAEFLVHVNRADLAKAALSQIATAVNSKHSADTTFTIEEILPGQELSQEEKDFILTQLCQAMQLEVAEDQICVSQNHIDLGHDAYCFLLEKGEPTHIQEILDYVNKKYPEKEIAMHSLKFHIWSHSEIVPMGKSSIYSLRQWNSVYTGNIRDLMRDIISASAIPVSLDEISDRVLIVFKNTTRKNIQASLSSSEDFEPYDNGYWGLAHREYDAKFKRLRLTRTQRSFDDRFTDYRAFVDAHQRHPYASGEESEETLCRWRTNVMKRILDVTDEQVEALKGYINSTLDLPQNGSEVKFQQHCHEYLKFYQLHHRHVTSSESQLLYKWYAKNSRIYCDYQDNRTRYFEDLISKIAAIDASANLFGPRIISTE